MNELYDNSCVSIQESDELIAYINSLVPISASAPNLSNVKGLNKKNTRKPTIEEKIEAAKTLAAITAKLLIGHFITLFVDLKLSEFAVKTIRKNQKNKKLFAFINNEVKKVYEKHPDYNPCSAKQFMKTSPYDYMMAEWRDKNIKEKAQYLLYTSIDNAITVIVSRSIPVPGSSVLAIPVKMMLTYCGFNFGIGSVYNIALEIDGETIAFGINYRPIGFTISNLILYTFKSSTKELIGTRLKDPPESLYKLTVEDAKSILAKYGANSDLEKIKKDVKRINSLGKSNNIFIDKIKKINEDYLGWYYDTLLEAPGQKNNPFEWKLKVVGEMKSNLAQFAQYAVKQTSNDIPFLQQNVAIIKNTKKFPVKPVNAIQNAPNYTAALQRLTTPLSTHLNGIDISKVETDTSDPNTNIPVKKVFIPTYNGQEEFSAYAKKYYHGSEANSQNLNPAQVAVLMQTAFQFCLGYQNKIKSLQTDFNAITNYVSQDTNGLPNQQNMQADMNNQQIQQKTPAAQGMASTNPNNNTNRAVNAAAEYESFMQEYFGNDWETLLEDEIKPIQNRSLASNQKPNPSMTTLNNYNNNSKSTEATPNGSPVVVNQAALLMKKKEVVCQILTEAFNAKLSALGMVYHDFIFLIRRHVSSYRGPEAANQGNDNQGG